MAHDDTSVSASGNKPFDEHVHFLEEGVREELERILLSPEFRSSKRSQEFLRYVIDHTLNGQAGMLKERTIGVEVFGRPATYDPSEDATVRVKASEVRKRLGLYYADHGSHDPIRIDLPSGTYVPEFRPNGQEKTNGAHPAKPETGVAVESVAEIPTTAAPVIAQPTFGLWYYVAGIVSIAIVVAIALWMRPHPVKSPLDQFWSPVLNGSAPVSLCAAFVPVYGLDRDARQGPPPRPEDFVLLTDQFVGGGDLIAVSRLSAMLTRMQRPYRVRLGSDVSFQDLRSAPAVLIGYSYTRWTEISSQMRYFIDASRRPIGVTDTGKATNWTLPNLPRDRHTSEDYAIISRVFQPDTHAMLVELAGITQYGTDAAADMLTNADVFSEVLRGAPSGWQQKNVQFVLHVKVIAGAPASPQVIATYFW